MNQELVIVKTLSALNCIVNVSKQEHIVIVLVIASIAKITLIMKKNRTEAIGAIIERNPNAFRPKIASAKQNVSTPISIQGTPHRGQMEAVVPRHSKG